MTLTSTQLPHWTGRYFQWMLILFIASFLVLPSAKMVNNAYYVFIALPALGALVLARGKIFRLTPLHWLWILFFIWQFGMVLAGGDVQDGKHLGYVVLFMLAAGQLADTGLLRNPIFARIHFWLVIAYIMGAAIFYWLTGKYLPGERVIWLPSRMDGAIFTSMWLAASFALALPIWLDQKRWPELSVATLLSLFALTYVLQSRSGLVGWIAIVALTLLYSATQSAKTRRVALQIGLISLTGSVVAALTIPQITQLITRADSLRFELWGILLGEWNNCGWWLGCGLHHSSTQLLSSNTPILHPHSIYLALGLFSGLPALLLFLALIFMTLQLAWRHRDPWGLYLVASLVSLLFDGSKIIDNPDERWLLVLLPMALIANPHGRNDPRPHARPAA